MNAHKGLLGSTVYPAWQPREEPRETSLLDRGRDLFRVGPC